MKPDIMCLFVFAQGNIFVFDSYKTALFRHEFRWNAKGIVLNFEIKFNGFNKLYRKSFIHYS